MSVVCIRGAITANENSKEEILNKTEMLLKAINETNNINDEDIVSIVFTMTKDLNKVYPAVAARKIGITQAALLCYQELDIEGSLEKCIRVMYTCEKDCSQKDVKHIYLEGAKVLRPDLAK